MRGKHTTRGLSASWDRAGKLVLASKGTVEVADARGWLATVKPEWPRFDKSGFSKGDVGRCKRFRSTCGTSARGGRPKGRVPGRKPVGGSPAMSIVQAEELLVPVSDLLRKFSPEQVAWAVDFVGECRRDLG